MTTSKYRWVIEKDLFDGSAKGVTGPGDASNEVADNASKFSLYDDDNQCMAIGTIYGDYDGFEPLDDFGTPNWGCTGIKYKGEWL